MGRLNEKAEALLSSTLVDMKTAGKTAMYTVPSGKSLIVTAVVVRQPTASLAGGTDYDFGTGVNADTWEQTVDLSAMTATTDYLQLVSANTKYSVEAVASIFGVKVITGSTAVANATIDLFGYLI